MLSLPIALEIGVAFGIPIAWGVWELVSLRREQARDREKAARTAATEQAPSADAASGTATTSAPTAR
jgi:hypothetical protein